MKSCMQIVFFIVAIGLLDSVQSDEDQGENTPTNQDPQETSPRRCPPLPPDDETQKQGRLNDLRDQVVICTFHINDLNLRDIVTQPVNNEKVIEDITNYCKLLPVGENCVAALSTQSEDCLNSTESKIFKITGVPVFNLLRVGCQNDGHRLSTIINAVKQLIPINSPTLEVIKSCLIDFQSHIHPFDSTTQDLSMYSQVYYTSARFFKDCIKERVTGPEDAKIAFDSLFVDLLDTMKCIGADGEEVTCEAAIESHGSTAR